MINKYYIDITIAFVAVISLILGIAGHCRNNKQDSDLNRVSYLTMAMNYKPQLVVSGDPKISDVIFSDTALIVDSIGHINIFIDSVIIDYTIKNTSEYKATIISILFADTTTGEEILREYILDKDVLMGKLRSAFINTMYFDKTQVEQNDSINLSISSLFSFQKHHLSTQHIIILYKNETDNLYDTYHLTRYNMVSPWIKLKQINKKEDLIKIIRNFSIESQHSSYHVYTAQEKQLLDEYIEVIKIID